MFVINLNEDTSRIQVTNNDEPDEIIIAEGNFAVDNSEHAVLIIFDQITISPDDYQQIDQFILAISSYINDIYRATTYIRFPKIFDNQIPFDKLQYHNESPDFMTATMDDLKYYPENNLQDRQEQYELITDRESILNYAEQIRILLNRNAYWATKWDFQEICNRINAVTYNAMILDKINNYPCAFGRLMLVTSKSGIFGYCSDVVVDNAHQSKGLGSILMNYLVGIVINLENPKCTLCLQCSKKGSGAISASKLYKRSGFQFLNDLGNRIAIFLKRKIELKDPNQS